jgi:hypothetical protein
MPNNTTPPTNIDAPSSTSPAASSDPETPTASQSSDTGRAAFERLQETLKAVTEIKHPRTSMEEAAATVLRVIASIEEHPEIPETFALMPAKILDPIHFARLEDLGEAGRYIARQLRDARILDGAHVRRLPADLSQESKDTRARMMSVLTYHVGDLPNVSPLLASIQNDHSYMNLASDLERLADLYHEHKQDLQDDRRRYQSTDESLARHLASRIVRELDTERRARVERWSLAQSQIWPLLTLSYGEVQDTAHYIWRHHPTIQALFPSLHHDTRPKTSKSTTDDPKPPSPSDPAL